MAWTVLCSNILLQQTLNEDGQWVNTAATYGVPFDEGGVGVPDATGRVVVLLGQTPLLASYRQPSDFWDLLVADLESQLASYDGYSSAEFYRVDLPS